MNAMTPTRAAMMMGSTSLRGGFSLENSLPLYAVLTAEAFGLKVQIGGDKNACDGETIFIAGFDSNDPEMKELVWAIVCHESFHKRYTDYDTWFRAADGTIRQSILNIIEDVWIERAGSDDLPGSRNRIGALFARWAATGRVVAATDKDSPAQVLASYLLHRLRSDVLGHQALAPLAEAEEPVLRQMFPPGAVTRLHGLMARVKGVCSTSEALALTEDILRMLQEEQKKEEERQDPLVPPDGGSGGDGTGDGTGDDQTPADARPPQDGDDSPPCGDGGGQGDGDTQSGSGDDDDDAGGASGLDGQDDGDSGEGSNATADDDASMGGSPGQGAGTGGADVLQQVLATQAADIAGIDAFAAARQMLSSAAAASPSTDRVSLPVADLLGGDTAAGSSMLQRVQNTAHGARYRLEGLLMAERQEEIVNQTTGSRLDTRRMNRLLTGDMRVFRRRVYEESPNTAFHVLVDRSISMDGRMKLTVEAALALAWAVEGLDGVNPAVTAFPGRREDRVFSMLRHGEKIQNAVRRFPSVTAGGGTPMLEGLWYAASQVLLQDEERKIILVLTDGQPMQEAQVILMLDRLKRSGIHVAAIGIMTDYVQHLFDTWAVVNALGDLRNALFDITRKLLS